MRAPTIAMPAALHRIEADLLTRARKIAKDHRKHRVEKAESPSRPTSGMKAADCEHQRDARRTAQSCASHVQFQINRAKLGSHDQRSSAKRQRREQKSSMRDLQGMQWFP